MTILLLAVAFGSQTLHHQAMRSLVGDRDLKTVQSSASSIDRELGYRSSFLQIIARDLDGGSEFSDLSLPPDEISASFDGGIALYAEDGQLIQSSGSLFNWQTVPGLIPGAFQAAAQGNSQPVFSGPVSLTQTGATYIFLSVAAGPRSVLVGAFSPERLIGGVINDLSSSGQTTVLVISPSHSNGSYDILYRAGPVKMDESNPAHPGIQEVLRGESGIRYVQSDGGEHIAAFSPILSTGWGLITEEAWEDIASPYLITTQSAPLVIVPAFLLALVAIWFGARSIVTPLQKLERQAARLASGQFNAIRQPVGGIEEIRNLHNELVEMADELSAAQQSLRGYIGAITAGVENERRSLARELHDDTIQSLIVLNQRIQLLLMSSPETQKAGLSELREVVQQTMTNLRRMIRGLRPIYLEDLGLAASLEMLAQEMEQANALPITFSVSGRERRLDPEREMSLYRMAQESLNNVIHHAEARHAWLVLKYGEHEVEVQVRDDGKGFTVPGNQAEFTRRGHFGLLGLHERADLIKAELRIQSRPGSGTSVSIRLPLLSGSNST